MDRREILKAMMLAGFASGTVLQSRCRKSSPSQADVEDSSGLYGRTPEEMERDKALSEQLSPFSEDEIITLALLCDIILPANMAAPSASDTGVVEFIDFIVRDMPRHELPLKGGLMWLSSLTNQTFGKLFKDLNKNEQLEIVDAIAYPQRARAEMLPGVRFFNLMRDLTLTGYYTSPAGMADLGYQGNSPNVWDGVPEEILRAHKLEYEEDWIRKCVDQTRRHVTAEWDDEGRLLT